MFTLTDKLLLGFGILYAGDDVENTIFSVVGCDTVNDVIPSNEIPEDDTDRTWCGAVRGPRFANVTRTLPPASVSRETGMSRNPLNLPAL